MPSSRTVTVERLAEGSRRVMLDFTVPQDHELVILEDETHTHLVYGIAEELEAHGLKEVPKAAKPKPGEEVGGGQTAPAEKPKPKSPAKKKSAAKSKAKA